MNDLVGNAPFSTNNTLPKGWLIEQQDGGSLIARQNDKAPRGELAVATQLSEQLLDIIEIKTGIQVSTAYLTVSDDNTYHVHLLVSPSAYHSPGIRAAHILIEQYVAEHTNISIRFHFTIEREYAMYTNKIDTQRLKFVHGQAVRA